MMVLDFTQLLHGLRYHRSWRRSAFLNFRWFWHVDFLRFFWPLCSSQTLIKARFAAKVASSLFESWWMSCSFHAVSKLNPMCEKVSETSPRLHFLVDSKLVPRDPARKYWLPSRKLAKNPFDVGEYLSIPHIETYWNYQRVFANPMVYHNKIPHSAVHSGHFVGLTNGFCMVLHSGLPRAESRGSSGVGPSECPGCGHLPIASAAVGGFQLLRRKKTMQPQPDSLDISTYTITHTHMCIYI